MSITKRIRVCLVGRKVLGDLGTRTQRGHVQKKVPLKPFRRGFVRAVGSVTATSILSLRAHDDGYGGEELAVPMRESGTRSVSPSHSAVDGGLRANPCKRTPGAETKGPSYSGQSCLAQARVRQYTQRTLAYAPATP